MKKLLLLAAIVGIGANLYASLPPLPTGLPAEGGVANLDGILKFDDGQLYQKGLGSLKVNDLRDGFDDITTNDKSVDNDGAVNIFRKEGEGREDTAITAIALKVLEPIIIESEADFMYVEAVAGDGLNIGDIGFRVKGYGNAEIKFTSAGPIFQLPNARMTIKGHKEGAFYSEKEVWGTGTVAQSVYLRKGRIHELEVDVYLPNVGGPGLKVGSIFAEARYE